jgi:hypothetical protein
MAIAAWGGIKLDQYLSVKYPYFTILFALFSFLLSLYVTIKNLLRRIKKEETSSMRKKGHKS